MSRSKRESPSKKLRNVYFSLWSQKKEGFEDFEKYYDNKMNKLIVHFQKMVKK